MFYVFQSINYFWKHLNLHSKVASMTIVGASYLKNKQIFMVKITVKEILKNWYPDKLGHVSGHVRVPCRIKTKVPGQTRTCPGTSEPSWSEPWLQLALYRTLAGEQI